MIPSSCTNSEIWRDFPVLEKLSSSVRVLASRVSLAVRRFFEAIISACQSKEGLRDFFVMTLALNYDKEGLEQIKRINVTHFLVQAMTLSIIRGVSQEDRNELIQQARQLFTERENGQSEYARSDIIKTLRNIPKEDRNEFIAQARLLFTEREAILDEYSRGEIIRALSTVPKEDRNELIQQARQLFTERENGQSEYARSDIINALGEIPREDRNELIAQARQLFAEYENGQSEYARRDIINALGEIPREDRNELIAQARRLFAEYENGQSEYARRDIINALGEIPREDRNELIAQARRLFAEREEGQNENARRQIIQTLSSISKEDRNAIIGYVEQLRNRIDPQAFERECAQIVGRLANLPAEERVAFVANYREILPARQQQGINVHEGNRDEKTLNAFKRLQKTQGKMASTMIERFYEEFQCFLDQTNSFSDERKERAKHALCGERNTDDFGPLIGEASSFTVLGTSIYGKELIARLWIFSSSLEEPEQTNAKRGMISALTNSYYENGGFRVCNPGKMQRLLVAVLQGRLEGADIDNVDGKISVTDAINRFFSVQEHQNITCFATLMEAADTFIAENPLLVDKEGFREEMKKFARTQGMIEEETKEGQG